GSIERAALTRTWMRAGQRSIDTFSDRKAARPAKIWRYEIEVSDSAGFLAPAYLAGSPDSAGNVQLTPATLAVTVETKTVICSTPLESNACGDAAAAGPRANGAATTTGGE